MSWQPIETAPRDGSAILAYSDWYSLPFVVFWSSRAEEFGPMPALPEGSFIEKHWLLANSEDGTILYSPTLWMPIPATPS